MAVAGGVSRAMRITALLILWSLPIIPPSGGSAPSPDRIAVARPARQQTAPPAWGKTRKAPLPASPSRKNLCVVAAEDEEEDSSEDAHAPDGLPLSRLWRDSGQGEWLA